MKELFAHPGVAQFSDFINLGPFTRFSLSREKAQPALMAEYDDGHRRLIAGFVDNAEGLGLSEWKPPARFGG